jgi:protocatechuate 3,4-dioxygenase beta subunit
MTSAGEDRYTNTVGQRFLRGYQISDTQGVVRFTTIYPGWYRGRAVHIHFKVRVPGAGEKGYAATYRIATRPVKGKKKGASTNP